MEMKVKTMQSTLQANIRVVTLEFNKHLNLIMPHVKTMKNTLKAMWDILDCHHVTCTQIDIDGRNYDIWSDDEALLTSKAIPTLYINDDLVLFGNLIFSTSDNEGATKGLSDEDMDNVLKFINRQTPKLINWIEDLKIIREHKNCVPEGSFDYAKIG